MFHPAKVIEVISSKSKNADSADESVQVLLSMWDENIFTFVVHPKIAEKVKADDIVLVDYTPITGTPAPKHTVVKILKGDAAKNVWNKYRQYFETKRKEAHRAASQQQMQQTIPMDMADDDEYMG